MPTFAARKYRKIHSDGGEYGDIIEELDIELFNLAWDPAERVNLADNYEEEVKRLQPVLNDFLKQTQQAP